jgi:cystathionine gamma-lyase
MGVFARYGIEFTLVDPADLDAIRGAIKENTRFLYLESPTNPLLTLSDIAACSAIAKEHKILTVVDNTFATPYLQEPLTLGADIVLHSMTKYIGGHSDVVGGCLMGNSEELREKLAFYQNACGGQLGPMDSFLFLRGTKTLALRMDRHCSNAMAIAKALEANPHVDKVFYPGLESHPGHELAKRQMSGFGGMVSFELKGGIPAANKFSVSTELFVLAESLGGVESLVEVPASMTHASIPPEERAKAGLKDGLVRLSVGVEHVDDLLSDVKQAIEAAAELVTA